MHNKNNSTSGKPDDAVAAPQQRRRDDRRQSPTRSLAGWQWLKLPGVLFLTVGLAGVLVVFVDAVDRLLGALRFPPLWSCIVLVAGGLVMLILSAVAYSLGGRCSMELSEPKSWRSL